MIAFTNRVYFSYRGRNQKQANHGGTRCSKKSPVIQASSNPLLFHLQQVALSSWSHDDFLLGSRRKEKRVCAQSYPTLCYPMGCSLPGCSVQWILQARILEWVAISSSRGSSQPRYGIRVSCVSCIGRQVLYDQATWEAPIERKEERLEVNDVYQLNLSICQEKNSFPGLVSNCPEESLLFLKKPGKSSFTLLHYCPNQC